ncbi:hypothetical protein J7443_07760 [Tropicibacter sp. R15_0]|uniref:hypothetical protein n=1 Tax=Tropicibacter sp. R15_0 TaxID=2821101 RepID=UPI001ADC217A|nr:hypothetical protein [Tropicibacter sp. R15_0]MBO9465119.1 hypothetical protein [Tropicibacter sp. R15_0]
MAGFCQQSLAPNVSARLYSSVKTQQGPNKDEFLQLGLLNNGNADLFVAKLILRPTDPKLAEDNPTTYVLRQTLPANGVIEESIALRPLRKARVGTVAIDSFARHKQDLTEAGRYRPGCYFIEPNDFDEADTPPLPQFAIAEAVTPLEAYITFSTPKTRGRAEELLVAKGLTGTLLFRTVCAKTDPPKDRLE